MAITDADRLRAEGSEVTLGGQRVRLRFSHRGKAELEGRFGSCVEFERQLNEAITCEGINGPVFTVALGGMAAALHGTLWTEPLIDGAMKSEDIGEYLTALFRAWEEAWPAADGKGAGGNGQRATSESPGGGTTAAPSSS